ncbi:GDSL esterase/lipase [Morus notabilis]|uniref:GDSL esterase/lipase n=3 Tax=Morus notabilis TaxID=981085 RepID=W9R666_9ROSA|nr:GDSL esterase/lipase [Morus notabilis]
MAGTTCEAKTWLLVFALSLVVSTMQLHDFCVCAKPQVPCFFIFGDSLADNGNNNQLSTLTKANYIPYGIDFSDGPTGRFTNGRTTVDILAELLGFENPIPSFASATANSSNLLGGVNYASGAAGILRATGKHAGNNISLRRQLNNHRITVSRIADVLGSKRLAKERLEKCLYWVEMGNNDYINNYYIPSIYPSSSLYNPKQYAALLIQNYQRHVMKLYSHGARMFALVGVGQIGCTPNSISVYGTNGSACVDYMNDAAQFFNQRLIALVDQLNTDLLDVKFIYVNSYGMGSGDPTIAGFKVWNVGCCAVNNNTGQCVPNKTPCENRNEYVFWDSFHPTEALNLITAKRVYNAYDPSDCYPMDISSLVQLFGLGGISAQIADLAQYW